MTEPVTTTAANATAIVAAAGRPARLRGRLPQKQGADRFPLKYAHEYLATPLPAPTYPVDVSEGITDWGMCGNDVWGDCFSAGTYHQGMSTAAAAGTPIPDPNANTAVEWCEAYTGATTPPGPGAVLADFLLWGYKRGYWKAFAPVDHTNREQCDGIMQAGFGLYVGVSLTDDAEQLFPNSPWTVANGETPDPSDGHCIVRVRSDSTAQMDTYVTWGALQQATYAWTEACLDEAWLVVTTEEQLAAFDPALLADIDALGGTGGRTAPAVAPPAPPAPTPEPHHHHHHFIEDIEHVIEEL